MTATAFNATVTATVLVTVRRPVVRSITPSEASVQLRERQLRRLAATVVTTGNLTRRVSFVSRAPAIASVRVVDSLTAEVTAVSVGSTVVDLIAVGDSTQRVAVPVTVDPSLVASIRIVGLTTQDSLLLGTRRTLTAVLRDSAGVELRDRVVRWSSETPSTATVSTTGEVQAIRAGPVRFAARVAIGDGSGDRVDTVSTRVFGSLDIAVLPRSATVEEGQRSTLQATVTATSGIDRSIDWESSRPAVASVSASGEVTGVVQGSATIRARSRALASVVDSAIVTVVSRGVPTTLSISPSADTLSPNGTRLLQGLVRDQRGTAITGAAVSWRSLTPALASVSAGGTVTALALGEARIVATSPRLTGTDSLADTARILIVNPCTRIRAVPLGTTITGQIDASTCRNTSGFATVDQYGITSATQAYFSVTSTLQFAGSIVPLNIGNGFYGWQIAPAATRTAFAVMRPGTFGFMVSGDPGASGRYTVTTALNPDPRSACVETSALTGVTFQTAVWQTCVQRDIYLLPIVAPGQRVRVTASAASFGVRIELRTFRPDAFVVAAQATQAGGTATINHLWNSADFAFLYVRVIGGLNQNDLVTITIDP